MSYVNLIQNKPIIFEEFLWYEPIRELNRWALPETVFFTTKGLDLNKLIAQCYDGASVMTGHVGGVQKVVIIRYPMPLFFHCTNHVLNLVINDLNKVIELRNAIGTIKKTICTKYFAPQQDLDYSGLMCILWKYNYYPAHFKKSHWKLP